MMLTNRCLIFESLLSVNSEAELLFPIKSILLSKVSHESDKMEKPTKDDIIKYVTSSNLDALRKYVTGEPPVVDEFPLCGKWRKNITLMHLAAAYGSLTCITFFLGKIDINARTLDVPSYFS